MGWIESSVVFYTWGSHNQSVHELLWGRWIFARLNAVRRSWFEVLCCSWVIKTDRPSLGVRVRTPEREPKTPEKEQLKKQRKNHKRHSTKNKTSSGASLVHDFTSKTVLSMKQWISKTHVSMKTTIWFHAHINQTFCELISQIYPKVGGTT